MSPFFSIILPTYNRAHLLANPIDSMLDQQFTDWELIIIDDGSTDNTRALVHAYTEKDSRIHYYFKVNEERSVARNYAIERARGTYICFIDSDDRYTKDNLAIWRKFIESHGTPVAMMYGDMRFSGKQNGTVLATPITGNSIFDFLFTNPIVPGRVCIHRSILEKIRFEPDIHVGEDVTLWLKIACDFPVLYSPHVTSIYLVHDENSVAPNRGSEVKMLNGITSFFVTYPHIKAKITRSVYAMYFSSIFTNVAKFYLTSKQRRLGINYLLKAIILAPKHPQTKYRLRLLLQSVLKRNNQVYE